MVVLIGVFEVIFNNYSILNDFRNDSDMKNRRLENTLGSYYNMREFYILVKIIPDFGGCYAGRQRYSGNPWFPVNDTKNV
jgi:hypothetical protein